MATRMNKNYRIIFQFIFLYVVLLSGGMIIIDRANIDLAVSAYANLLTVMLLISLGTYLLVMLSFRKSKADRGVYLLAALGGKFLAYLIMVLIFYVAGKNLSREFIIAFFILYLMLTFFLIRILLKVLKFN